MEHAGFFKRAGPFTLDDLTERAEARPSAQLDMSLEITDVLPLDEAVDTHLSFFDNIKYLKQFEKCSATACFAAERYAERAPEDVAVLVADNPYRSFALSLAMFYPEALKPRTIGELGSGYAGGVHPSAMLEEGVIVEPGAAIGPEAHIGKGTVIGAGACIGYRVCVGRDCFIGPNVTITNALVGNEVIVHPGVCIGQDGFGFSMGPQGHLKVPQIGRVIIQDCVEIGASTTIDRGALKDTIIGEGTKIDNQVQIGHNVVIGRGCIIVAQVGISGSVEMEDGVVLGGQVGVVGHVRIGAGAQIAATSNVRCDVPPGAKWGGTPAKPISKWFREIALVQKAAESRSELLNRDNRTKS